MIGVVRPDAGRGKSVRARIERNVGLAEAFLRGGVANYVGTYWPVGDQGAVTFAKTFYESLISGASIGSSLSAGRRAVHGLGNLDWVDYVHYGSRGFCIRLRED